MTLESSYRRKDRRFNWTVYTHRASQASPPYTPVYKDRLSAGVRGARVRVVLFANTYRTGFHAL
jgi:hypothetical protein